MRLLVVLAAALATAACAPLPPRPSAHEIHYVEATPDGGVVQAASEDAAEEQMRGRCPGGYRIVRAEPVPIGQVSTTRHERDLLGNRVAVTDTRAVVAQRYTYACTRYVQASRI